MQPKSWVKELQINSRLTSWKASYKEPKYQISTACKTILKLILLCFSMYIFDWID